MGISRDCPSFLSTAYYLRNSISYELHILYALSYDQSQQKSVNNFGKSSHVHSQGLPNFFRASMYRAHRGHLCDSMVFLLIVCCNVLTCSLQDCHLICVWQALSMNSLLSVDMDVYECGRLAMYV